jgi:hypothetical protein
MTTETEMPSVLSLVTQRVRPWRPADFLPLATDITAGASGAPVAEMQARTSTPEWTPECTALVERLRADVATHARRVRILSDELFQMRREKAALDQEMAAATHKDASPHVSWWRARRGKGAR